MEKKQMTSSKVCNYNLTGKLKMQTYFFPSSDEMCISIQHEFASHMQVFSWFSMGLCTNYVNEF